MWLAFWLRNLTLVVDVVGCCPSAVAYTDVINRHNNAEKIIRFIVFVLLFLSEFDSKGKTKISLKQIFPHFYVGKYLFLHLDFQKVTHMPIL